MTTDDDVRRYLPSLFAQPPTTVRDVLLMTSMGLREEDRWAKQFMYLPDRLNPDSVNDPFCGRWSACLLGMVYVITSGVRWYEGGKTWETAYGDRTRALRVATEQALLAQIEGTSIQVIATFNDDPLTTLEDVLALVDRAVAAEPEPQTEASEETDTE